jgi:uncharacterized damage-inducible protein DinB
VNKSNYSLPEKFKEKIFMRIVDSILQELEQEAATTRRLLERVPGDKLSWKPHERSMSLGQLAHHVATTPGGVAELAQPDSMEMPDFGETPSCNSPEELLKSFDEGIAKAKETLNGFDDQKMMVEWKVEKGGQQVMAMPRIGLVRSILLNHWYHHRGQLTVYLRLLDIPLPPVYGPTADENPFA